MTQRLAKGVGKPKPIPICPFLFHLYNEQGPLTEDEELDYRTTKEMAGYWITPDPDSRPGSNDEGATPTPAASPVQEVPVRTPNRRRKTTYRAPAGSPPVRSRGPSSPVPPEPSSAQLEQQPTPRPGAQPEATQPEDELEWVARPFDTVTASLQQARRQYLGMEEALEEIGSELGVEPKGIIQKIRSLPKAREMEELRARIAGLLKEIADLQTQVADQDRKVKEAEARAVAAVEERIRAEAEREKWHTVFRKFFNFVGFPSNVVTKARLYDQCMKKSEVEPAPKILRMLVDFSGRVENLLKELCVLPQYDRRGQEAGPSE